MDDTNGVYASPEFKRALAEYEKAKADGKEVFLDSADITDIAWYYLERKLTDKAAEAARCGIDMHPGCAGPLMAMARIELSKGSGTGNAKMLLEQVSYVERGDMECNMMRAEILICDNKAKEADAFLKGVYGSMDDEDDRDDLALDSVELFLDYFLLAKAKDWLARVNDVERPDYKELAASVEMHKGNYAQSEKIFKELLDDNPYSHRYWNKLAQSQFMSDDMDGSIESSEFSLAINPEDPEAIRNKADALMEKGNCTEAARYYHRYAEKDPQNPEAYLLEAEALMYAEEDAVEGKVEDNEEKVVALLKKAEKMEVEPGGKIRVEAQRLLAIALSRYDRHGEALEYADKLVANPEAVKSEAHYTRGVVLIESGKARKATEEFQTALTSEGADFPLVYNVATTYLYCGYAPTALALYRSLYEQAGYGVGYGYAKAARAAYETGRMDEAYRYMQTACDKTPGDAEWELGHIFGSGTPVSQYCETFKKEHNL